MADNGHGPVGRGLNTRKMVFPITITILYSRWTGLPPRSLKVEVQIQGQSVLGCDVCQVWFLGTVILRNILAYTQLHHLTNSYQ